MSKRKIDAGPVVRRDALWKGCSSQPKSANAFQADLVEVPRTITVVGEGSVNLQPDIAIINVGAEARAQSVSEAKAEVDAQMADIVAALQNMGVSEKDPVRKGLFRVG